MATCGRASVIGRGFTLICRASPSRTTELLLPSSTHQPIGCRAAAVDPTDSRAMKDKRRSFAHGRVVALAAALSCGAVATAQAEVHIEGSPDAVRITANHDTIAGVLAAVAT